MQLERILRKNFGAVWILLLAGSAFFTARAFTLGLGIVLAGGERELEASPLVLARAAGGSAHAVDAASILARNPFDHTTGPLAAPSNGPIPNEGQETDPAIDKLCDSVMVTAIVEDSDADRSFVALTDGGEGKSVLRRRGQEAYGKRIQYIRWDRVWMTDGHVRCQAKLFERAAGNPSSNIPPAKPSTSTVPPDIARGIQKVGPREYNIDRGVRDRILESAPELMKMVRISPEKEGDRSVGIRLFGVKPDTVLGLMGLENGDRLQNINGFDITNPGSALEAFARLSTAEKLTVQINRAGKTMNLDYNVR